MLTRGQWAEWRCPKVVTKGRRTGWLVVTYSYINLLKSLYFLYFFDFLELSCIFLNFLKFLDFSWISSNFLTFQEFSCISMNFQKFLNFPKIYKIFLNFQEFLDFLFSGSWLDLLKDESFSCILNQLRPSS